MTDSAIALPSARDQNRPFGLLHTFLGLALVGGFFAILISGRIEPRDPHPATSPAPVVPQGAVFLGALGSIKAPKDAGHAVAVRWGKTAYGVTTLSVFGPEGLPAPNAEGDLNYFLFDLDQKAVVRAKRSLPLEDAHLPHGSGDVGSDVAIFELARSESMTPLLLQERTSQVGDSIWQVCQTLEGQVVTLGEIAEVRPNLLTVYVANCDVSNWAGTPWLNAEGEVVGVTSQVVGGADTPLLVYLVPATQIATFLNAATPQPASTPAVTPPASPPK
ncbi:MAG: hypothetical protein JKY65_29420 [Planctomycetes bacterium]|nr:hypothetical protein [Planctomycetota bacterium]